MAAMALVVVVVVVEVVMMLLAARLGALVAAAALPAAAAGGYGGARLRANFYESSCPQALQIVRSVLQREVAKEPRVPAFMLRLHFHDCFVNGCDGSILLDDQPGLLGEKSAFPNLNSIQGLDVVDNMKTALEAKCPGIVSCADILAIAARDSVYLAGGPYWSVMLGRRDSLSADQNKANVNLPGPFENVTTIISKFQAVGLSMLDVVTLSGGHSIGQARCLAFSSRLYDFNGNGEPDATLDNNYLQILRQACPENGGNPNAQMPLEPTNVNIFSNQYYKNLMNNMGLLQSDQELFSMNFSSSSIRLSFANAFNFQPLVRLYATNQYIFFSRFKDAMVRMGNLSPLTGLEGQIRRDCRVVNS